MNHMPKTKLKTYKATWIESHTQIIKANNKEHAYDLIKVGIENENHVIKIDNVCVSITNKLFSNIKESKTNKKAIEFFKMVCQGIRDEYEKGASHRSLKVDLIRLKEIIK